MKKRKVIFRVNQKKVEDIFSPWAWKFERVDGPLKKEEAYCSDPKCSANGGTWPCFNGPQKNAGPCKSTFESYPCGNPWWEKFLCSVSNKIQNLLWLWGISIHNYFAQECTIDFSCCAKPGDKHYHILESLVEAVEKNGAIIKIKKLDNPN